MNTENIVKIGPELLAHLHNDCFTLLQDQINKRNGIIALFVTLGAAVIAFLSTTKGNKDFLIIGFCAFLIVNGVVINFILASLVKWQRRYQSTYLVLELLRAKSITQYSEKELEDLYKQVKERTKNKYRLISSTNLILFLMLISACIPGIPLFFTLSLNRIIYIVLSIVYIGLMLFYNCQDKQTFKPIWMLSILVSSYPKDAKDTD